MGGPCIKGDQYEDGKDCLSDYGDVYDVPRHDPILVRVVEQLGKKASGKFANLQVDGIEGKVYRIDEYDGMETVVTPDEVKDEWVCI